MVDQLQADYKNANKNVLMIEYNVDKANALLDAEYEVNADKKLLILAEAEKLLPIKNADAERKAWFDIADRWEAAGKVPRAKMGEFEAGRFSDSEVQAVFHLLVVNTNNFPVTISGITYQVSLAGKKVAEGTHGVGIKTAIASTDVFDVSAVMNEESHGKDVKKLIKGLVVPYEMKAELKTPLYSEPLSAKGDIKLTVSKDK